MAGPASSSEPWRAQYNDGRTAATRHALVALNRTALVIRDDADVVLACWPVAEVRLLDPPDADGRIRLARAEAAERLVILTPGALPALERHCPALRRSAYGGLGWRTVLIWTLAAAGAVASLFLVAVPFLARHAADWVSPRLEAELGRRTAKTIITLFARPTHGKRVSLLCNTGAGRQVLNKLAAPLTAAAKLPSPVEIRVVNAPLVNAVALPGGQILLFKGLIDFTQQPNELAGVLAHELAHLVLRHPTEVVVERSASAFLVGLLLGDVFGGSVVAGLGQSIISASYSREAERAADARGVALLKAAGLDARPLAVFFARIAAKEGAFDQIVPFLNSHPATEERIKLLNSIPPGGREALDSSDWLALKTLCG